MAMCLKGRPAHVLAACVAVLLLTVTLVRAQEAPPNPPQPKAPLTRIPPLADVDLQGQFDPRHEKYTYLHHLGRTVDEARQKADAESVAMAAALLFQAERASGKKSPDVTASGLLEEATKLAEAQKNPAALQACAAVWGSAVFGPNDSARASILAQAARTSQVESQGVRRTHGRLLVRNKTRYAVNVYVDDEHVGSLSGYESGRMRVYTGSVRLYATSQYHEYSWGPRKVDLASDYTWTLTD